MQVEPISKLVTAPYNPRTISEKQMARLKKSLEQDPGMLEARPLIVNKRNMHVVGGNMRLQAAKELGWSEIPVHYVDLDEKSEKRWNMKDNAMYGEWENKLLGELLKVMSPQEIDDTGLDQATIDAALKKAMADLNMDSDADAVPEAPESPISVLGDVWVLGDHRLMCGDATKKEDVEQLMAGEKADMVFTDPPFGNNLGYGRGKLGERRIENDENSEAMQKSLPTLLKESKDKSHLAIWVQWRTFSELKLAADALGMDLRTVVVWDKKQPGLSGGGFAEQHEWLCVFVKGEARQNEYSGNVWVCARESSFGGRIAHPHMKPIELLERAINLMSNTGGVVLDVFGGSGSTLIACEQTKRKCRMMELDPKYVDVIIKRWENLTGKKAEKLVQ